MVIFTKKEIFPGDFTDSGPKIRVVLDIAKTMVENGDVLAVLGNHELNVLAFHAPNPYKKGEYLRPRTTWNRKQIKETLIQLGNSLATYLHWFKSLSL